MKVELLQAWAVGVKHERNEVFFWDEAEAHELAKAWRGHNIGTKRKPRWFGGDYEVRPVDMIVLDGISYLCRPTNVDANAGYWLRKEFPRVYRSHPDAIPHPDPRHFR